MGFRSHILRAIGWIFIALPREWNQQREGGYALS